MFVMLNAVRAVEQNGFVFIFTSIGYMPSSMHLPGLREPLTLHLRELINCSDVPSWFSVHDFQVAGASDAVTITTPFRRRYLFRR